MAFRQRRREVQAIATDNDDNAVQSSVVSAFAHGTSSVCSKVTDNDDAETRWLRVPRSVLGSSDLELMNDGGALFQTYTGLRFNGLNIPPGATITGPPHHVQFTVDESRMTTPLLNIYGQASANAPTLHPTITMSAAARAPAPPSIGSQQTAGVTMPLPSKHRISLLSFRDR